MRTRSWMGAAASVVALAVLVAPGEAFAGKVKVPPGDNSNFWERWKPAKEERIVVVAGRPTASADVASDAVVVDVPVVCGISWHGVYISPSPCTADDIALARLGAPYDRISPSFVDTPTTSAEVVLLPDEVACRKTEVAPCFAEVPAQLLVVPLGGRLRFVLPSTAIAASKRLEVSIRTSPWIFTNAGERARSFMGNPPDWVDTSTTRSVKGWWMAEGAISQQQLHAGPGPYLPTVPGALARLGRSGDVVRETLASVGAQATFMWGDANHRVLPAMRVGARLACGPLDPALSLPGTSRAVVTAFANMHEAAPWKKCSTLVEDLGYPSHGGGMVQSSGLFYGDVLHVYIVASDPSENTTWAKETDYTLAYYGKKEAFTTQRLSPRLVVATLDGPTPAIESIVAGGHFPNQWGDAVPEEWLRSDSKRLVTAGRRVLEGFASHWRGEVASIRIIQDAFHAAPDGVLSDPANYQPYDPEFVDVVARVTGAADAEFWPVGFAMPIVPDGWQSIAAARQDSSARLDISIAFADATK